MSEETPPTTTTLNTHNYVLDKWCTIQPLQPHKSWRLTVMFDAEQVTGDDDNVSICGCKQTQKLDAGADDDAYDGGEDDDAVDDGDEVY